MNKGLLIFFCLTFLLFGFVGAAPSFCFVEDSNYYGRTECSLSTQGGVEVNVGGKNYELTLISMHENEARIRVLNKDMEQVANNPWEWTILEGETNGYVDLMVKNDEMYVNSLHVLLLTSNCMGNNCLFFDSQQVSVENGKYNIWAGSFEGGQPTIIVGQDSEVFSEGMTKKVGGLEITLDKIETYGYDYDYFTGEPLSPIKNILVSYSEAEESVGEGEEEVGEGVEEEVEEIEDTSERFCEDSDGGRNIYERGNINGLRFDAQKNDYFMESSYETCIPNGGFVVEEYCGEGNVIKIEQIECPKNYFCEEGACRKKEEVFSEKESVEVVLSDDLCKENGRGFIECALLKGESTSFYFGEEKYELSLEKIEWEGNLENIKIYVKVNEREFILEEDVVYSLLNKKGIIALNGFSMGGAEIIFGKSSCDNEQCILFYEDFLNFNFFGKDYFLKIISVSNDEIKLNINSETYTFNRDKAGFFGKVRIKFDNFTHVSISFDYKRANFLQRFFGWF